MDSDVHAKPCCSDLNKNANIDNKKIVQNTILVWLENIFTDKSDFSRHISLDIHIFFSKNQIWKINTQKKTDTETGKIPPQDLIGASSVVSFVREIPNTGIGEALLPKV